MNQAFDDSDSPLEYRSSFNSDETNQEEPRLITPVGSTKINDNNFELSPGTSPTTLRRVNQHNKIQQKTTNLTVPSSQIFEHHQDIKKNTSSTSSNSEKYRVNENNLVDAPITTELPESRPETSNNKARGVSFDAGIIVKNNGVSVKSQNYV